MTERDWYAWHDDYDRPSSGAHRLTRAPSPLDADASMFSFTPYDPLTGPLRT